MSFGFEYSDIKDFNADPPDVADIENTDITETLDDISKDISDDIAETTSDYSFRWDGTPTHCVEWDEECDPAPKTRKLTR